MTKDLAQALLDTNPTDGNVFKTRIFLNNLKFDNVKRNFQSELNQGLLVVKLSPSFWESSSRCYAFCSKACTLPSAPTLSPLAKPVSHPLGWNRYMKRSPCSFSLHAAHSAPKKASSSPGIFTSSFAVFWHLGFICGQGDGGIGGLAAAEAFE